MPRMGNIRAGELRHKVTFQTFTEARAPNGQVTRSWVDANSRWASIEAVSNDERYQADRQEVIATHQIRIRYYDGLTRAMRITFGTRTFNIVQILQTREIQHEQILLVKENTA